MSKETTGGAAFPLAESPTDTCNPGMELLDYFAAKAMCGILSSPNCNRQPNAIDIAKNAYTMATAMLEERKKYMQ